MAHDQQRYRVIERLEAGGMAEVFKAEAFGLQGFKKQVAIKRVLPHLAAKESFIRMFLDEARLSAKLSHSNCVQVFDIGVGDNTYFIVMEFVDGANLRSIIDLLRNQGRDFPIEEAIYIAIELCKGLQYAHNLKNEHGQPLSIVHRDMSPPNVLMTKHGEVKIVDFGLAKANTQLEKSEPGIIKGKFSYLAPEAVHARELDARADIFAVGIMLWELLAGRRLFLGKTDLETVQLVQRAIIPPISKIRPDVPVQLEPILQFALAQDPNQRYATAREFGADLNSFLYQYARRPVTDFDIADLVLSAMEQRRREREAQGKNVIDEFMQWAEQVVFQFQSLEEKDAGAKAIDVGSLTGAYSRPSNADLAKAQTPPYSLRPPGGPTNSLTSVAPDNLSELEDIEPSHAVLPAVKIPQAPAVPKADVRAPSPKNTPSAKGNKWMATVGIIVLAVAGVVGGLLVSGVIKF